MILGAFTLFHVILSLVGILAGVVVLYGLLTANRFDGWTKTFLVTTVATSVTGFMFPFNGLTPGYVLGVLSLIALALTIAARYRFHLTGAWRKTYVISAVISLYFNVFVLVAQMFKKIPALKALAPTQSEPPFQIAQLAVLILFVVLGFLAAVKFRVEPIGSAVAAGR
jgi:hypothetical protein